MKQEAADVAAENVSKGPKMLKLRFEGIQDARAVGMGCFGLFTIVRGVLLTHCEGSTISQSTLKLYDIQIPNGLNRGDVFEAIGGGK